MEGATHTVPRLRGTERMEAVDLLIGSVPGADGFGVGRYLMRRPGHGLTRQTEPADAAMAVLHLRPSVAHDVWRDGRHRRLPTQPGGALTVMDLRHSWLSDLPEPFHTVNFLLPRAALDRIARELGLPAMGEFGVLAGDRPDETLLHLAQALLPAFARREEANRLFVGHVLFAAATHVASRLAGMAPLPPRARGGLALWQERRAKAMLAADLAGNITLVELATACGLSRAHFLRAFRQSTGLTPHRWLLVRRVAVAQEMLAAGALSLAEVAHAAGFADQSHLTRVFSKIVGTSPAAWRREMTSR
jgi:AraC family transcriptional regulator